MDSLKRRKRPTPSTSGSQPARRARRAEEQCSSIPPPVVNTFGIIFDSTEQRDRFEVLAHRSIAATKFADIPALRSLGLLDGVRALFHSLGWADFLFCEANTYSRLTLEFLSSFRMPTATSIAFRLFNVERHLTFTELNNIFGWRTDGVIGPTDKYPREFNESSFWRSITGLPTYNSRLAKASHIKHPCLRLAHRIVACTLFSRWETGTVSHSELFVLWAMTRPFSSNQDSASSVSLNTAAWLANKLLKVSESSSGDICCGGLITLIAIRPFISLTIPEGMEHVDDPTSLDLQILTRMHMIKPELNDRFTWLLGDTEYTTLPNPARTQVARNTNWLFPNPGETLALEDNPEEPPSYPPDFIDRCTAFETRFSILEGQVSDIQDRVGNIEDMMSSIYEWHVKQNHFPDTRRQR